MEIIVADQRILLFKDQLTSEEAKKKAWEKKTDSFDAISKVTSFLSRPKDDDFELIYEEHRYQPFWHVAAHAHYVYDRTVNYQVKTSSPEVRSVTVLGTDYQVTQGHIHVSVLEHCEQEENDVVFIDGVTGKNTPELKRYVSFSPQEVKGELEKAVAKDSILVPPQSRVSAIMRDSLAKLIKGIQADKILEEHVEVTAVDLYYHPMYAFQYRWKSKAKEAIVEVDGVTGEVSTGNRTFNEYLGRMLDRDFLLDIGADAAGVLVPGGTVAVKIAKRYMETRKLNTSK